MQKFLVGVVFATALLAGMAQAGATEVLYDQDFENPVGWAQDGGDVNIYRSVNDLFVNQPAGFLFAQTFTVETLLITGTKAFGTGYSDPSGIGGSYAIGMLSHRQNDLLGLSFDVGGNRYLNVRVSLSSIDLSVFTGPFIPQAGLVPEFQFTLFDNPTGALTTGQGAVLDQTTAKGTASPRIVFDWTETVLALEASGSSNGNVTLQIDLLSGEYAAFDNLRITASDKALDVGDPKAAPQARIPW